jgi:AcrR family transcriptional regulator
VSTNLGTSSRRHRARRGHGEALRGEILAAARDLLAESGSVEAVSVRAVATRVGVTTPSIYLHFKDKDDLIDAVCATSFGDLAKAMEEAGARANTPLERLLTMGRAYVRFALERPEQYRVAMMACSGQPVTVDSVLTDKCFQQLLSAVQECTEAGIFPPSPDGTLVLGLQLWSAAHGIASLLICKPWLPWGDVDHLVESTLRVAVAGCAVNGRLAGPGLTELGDWLVAFGRP